MIWYKSLNDANELLCQVELNLASHKILSGFKVEIVVSRWMETMFLMMILEENVNLLAIV